MFARRILWLAAAAAAALVVAAPGSADGAAPAWQPPTPPDGTIVTAVVGAQLELPLAAASADPALSVAIAARVLPEGATLDAIVGNPATATLRWTPTRSQIGDSTLQFTATVVSDPSLAAPPLALVVHVVAPAPPRVLLTGPGGLSHWARVVRAVDARTRPSPWARRVARVPRLTGEYLPNVVSLLEQRVDDAGTTWVRVRLAILPNGSTGWVPRSALGPFHELRRRLVVDRARLRATLYRGGFPIFRARVGVGRPQWPTPSGDFYVRERITNFGVPFYGPVLFGTSGRSAVLTDWPGGGYIGVHGTSLPELLPGRVSHGCIRMRNADILRLARLLPVGTPLTVR
jgi:hypothetical protein